ncbi:hypothetical protein ACVCG4_000597 [Citrobacter braakii]
MCKECVKACIYPIIKVKENLSSFELINKARRKIDKVKVDGCRVVSGKRCDWLFIDDESKKEVFVELKGTDVEYAFEQIMVSVKSLGKDKKPNGVIVCTRCPLNDTQSQLMKVKARKANITLTVKATCYKLDVENLVA